VDRPIAEHICAPSAADDRRARAARELTARGCDVLVLIA
jgi:hypothetical protein